MVAVLFCFNQDFRNVLWMKLAFMDLGKIENVQVQFIP